MWRKNPWHICGECAVPIRQQDAKTHYEWHDKQVKPHSWCPFCRTYVKAGEFGAHTRWCISVSTPPASTSLLEKLKAALPGISTDILEKWADEVLAELVTRKDSTYPWRLRTPWPEYRYPPVTLNNPMNTVPLNESALRLDGERHTDSTGVPEVWCWSCQKWTRGLAATASAHKWYPIYCTFCGTKKQ